MKHLILAVTVLVCLLVVAQVAYSQAGNIRNSKHDLSSSSAATIKSTNLDEVCVFCHTPHSKSTSPVLWNRNDPAGPFTAYSSPTMEQTVSSPAGVSKNCLSCHDGVTAFNSLINSPGSGAGTAPTMNTADMSGWDSLGTNMSNDHPVSLTYTTSQTTDAGLRVAALSGTHVQVSYNSITLPLYGTSTANATVECGSCHDPHSTTNGQFKRVANTASQLCFTCHNK